MEKRTIDFLLKYRVLLAAISVLVTLAIASGGRFIYFETDFKIFFKKDNPQLVAHEKIQEIYTSTDNLSIMLRAANGQIFNERMLTIIHEISELGWQAPYIMRVDSLTNFQNTSADNDDLLVEDLLLDPSELTAEKIAKIRAIAMSEKQLVQWAISADESTSLINLTLQLPPEVDKTAEASVQTAQRLLRDGSHREVVNFGRELIAQYQSLYPDLEMHLSGVSVINNSFNEQSEKDLQFLIPLMYGLILFLLVLFLRSIGAVVGSLIVIVCASAAAVGFAGWVGFALNAVNVMTPNVVLTIAVCDCVHLLVVYLGNLSQNMNRDEAMRESLRLNLQPIILTSITTAVGFLTLNFSSSPPFAQLGNMTAFGVLWAMVLTFTLLPAIAMFLTRSRPIKKERVSYINRYAKFVVLNRSKVLVGAILLAIFLSSLIPLNQINDDPINYFKPGVPFRDASEFAIEHLPGVKDMAFNIECGRASCINDPAFLTLLEEFVAWLESDPAVVHVSSYVDTIKRLNRSMNADNPEYLKIPDRGDLSAQYNLMYEMSLPYGLDLNNQLNLDKSATKVNVLTTQISSSQLINLAERSDAWLQQKHQANTDPAASVTLMFAHTGENNIRSMLWGGVLAIIGVTLTILIALRSFKYALISMLPNSVPAFMAFGLWGVLVGQVNMAVAAVFSISLGILVDDTVHFISKYRRARLIKGLSPEQSIEYAFEKVGMALVVTTVVLSIGFGLLAFSSFNLNAMTGVLTAITIVIALVFDFLILPPILMMFDRDTKLAA